MPKKSTPAAKSPGKTQRVATRNKSAGGATFGIIQSQRKPKLLVLCDFSETGFGRVGKSITQALVNVWDIVYLGINYYGDPVEEPFKSQVSLYPAYRPGTQDLFGMGRLQEVVGREQPDLIFIIQDCWNIVSYLQLLRECAFPLSRVVCYSPVDAENLKLDFVVPLNGINTLVAYNRFGANQFQSSFYTGDLAIIPHGVDLTKFYPVDRETARAQFGFPQDLFIVGLAGRNQARKRVDLAIQYFCEWAVGKPGSVKFLYHGAVQDEGGDLNSISFFWHEKYGHLKKSLHIKDENLPADLPSNLSVHYDGENRFMSTNIVPGQGLSVEELNLLYNTMDVHISTSWGDGFALCTAESMACGVPNISPDFAGLGEWPTGAVLKVPTDHREGLSTVSTVGALPDKEHFIAALDSLYYNYGMRKELGAMGKRLVEQPAFEWKRIAAQFNKVFEKALAAPVRNYGEHQLGITIS